MSSKWNERLVTSFLKTYKQHPCLWNPYHKDYYNCREKNEALQKIIDDLDIPGFTATDYLHQIKSIREKYKQEQTRVINSLQSQKQYKSPFSWYNILADMLKKVIDDEEKAQQRETTSVFRSLSSGNVKNSQRKEKVGTDGKYLKIQSCYNTTCDQVSRRSKSVEKPSRLGGKRGSTEKTIRGKNEKKVRYVPCPHFESKRDDSRDREEDTLSSYKPTRDTDAGVLEYSAAVPSTSMDSRSNDSPSLTRRNNETYEPPFLKCPLCGWENAKYEGAENNYVPCSGYNRNLYGGIYSTCTGCNKVTHDDLPYRASRFTNLPEYSKKYIDNSGDFDIIQDLPQYVPCSNLTIKPPEIEKAKKHIDAEIQYSKDPKKTSTDISAPTSIQTQVVQVDPVTASKLQYGTIEASTQLKIILSEPSKDTKSNAIVTENVYRNAQSVQGLKQDSSTKETQCASENIVPERKKYETGVNTINYVEKEVQNTVCISDGTRQCVSIQTLNQTEQTEREKSLKKSKEVAVNITDQVSKGIQTIVCVSRGNLTRCISLKKIVETGTTMSMHKVRSIGCVTAENIKEFKSTFVQCIPKEKLLILTRSKSHGSIKRCVRDTDLKHPIDKEIQESEAPCTTNTCPLNILDLIKEDPTVALALQRLLQNILFKYECETQSRKSNGQTDHQHKYHLKGNCLIDATEMVNAIKKYTMKMLEPSVTKDNLKTIHQKFDAESSLQEIKGKPSFAGIETSTIYDSKLTMTEENMFEPVIQSTVIKKDKGQRTLKDDTLPLEKTKRKFPMVEKQVCTHSNCKDVGTNGSLTQLRVSDVKIQTSSQLLKDSVHFGRHEKEVGERVSIGTQKRDPILVRVINCSGSQAIVKSDKETFTVGTDVEFEKKRSKRIETCGRWTCNLPTICRKTNQTGLESAFRKESENQRVNDYCRRSIPFKNICDKNCKTKISYDWTDVTNVDILSNVTNPETPMRVRPRKYTYARSK